MYIQQSSIRNIHNSTGVTSGVSLYDWVKLELEFEQNMGKTDDDAT